MCCVLPLVSLNRAAQSRRNTARNRISWTHLLLPSYKSRLTDFRRLFRDYIEDVESERMCADYACALVKEILIQVT